ncbi:tetratricopeptide repeat protein, partial [Acidobacteria bacterium AH-259-L09]|nr:tetratricopeptide repeat protein [Acidobacteria bacterium AH-259-L09]
MRPTKAPRARPGPWSTISPRSRLGLILLAAFLLPAATLAYLSITSVRSEAVARRHLIEETYRSIAGIVSSRIDARVQEIDRTLVKALVEDSSDLDALMHRLYEVEISTSWLQPLLLLDSQGQFVYPPRGQGSQIQSRVKGQEVTTSEFRKSFIKAETAELRVGHAKQAAALYQAAFRKARTPLEKILALNGTARCRLKANEPQAALETYQRLIETASPLDHEHTKWALIAHHQVIRCYQALAN